MKTSLSLAKQIKSMKPGEFFNIKTKKQRAEVCRTVKVLRDSGSIDFQVITKATDVGFTVAAIR